MISYTNKNNLPEQVIQVMEKTFHSYDAGDSYSATTLIDSPRIVQLKRRYKLTQDYTDLWAAFVGSLFHTHFEDHTQKRLTTDIDGCTISGLPDRIDGTTLIDYKTGGEVSLFSFAKPEWEKQLNIYAYLCTLNDISIKRIKVIRIALDWRQNSKSNTPSDEIDIPLWFFHQQHKFVKQQVEIQKAAAKLPTKQLPYCTAEEMWERPTRWAVMKVKQKRAVKLFDSKEEAVEYIPAKEFASGALYLENRPGERVRCENYCPCKTKCSQYKEYKNASL